MIDGYGICFTVAQGSVTLLASGGYGIDYIMLSHVGFYLFLFIFVPGFNSLLGSGIGSADDHQG